MGKFQQTPSLQALVGFATPFRLSCDAANPQRDAIGKMYEMIAEESTLTAGKKDIRKEAKKRNKLLGILSFELELIKQFDYNGASPGKRSRTYTVIKDFLGVKTDLLEEDKVFLDDDQRLIWMYDIYDDVKNNPANYASFEAAKGACTQKFFWAVEEKSLVASIENRIKALAKRLQGPIEALTKAKPSREALHQQAERSVTDYKDTVAKRNLIKYWMTTSWHEELLDLVRFVDQTSEDLYGNYSRKDKTTLTMAEANSDEDAQNATIAANLFVVLDIDGRYRFFNSQGTTWFGFTLREGSETYKKCLENINRDELGKVTEQERVGLLNVLFAHLNKVEAKMGQNDPRYKDILEKWKKLGFNDVAKFKKLVLDSIVTEQARRSNSWTACIINGTVQTGLGLTAASLLAKFGLGTVAGIAISNPIGLAAVFLGSFVLTPIGMKVLSWGFDYTVGTASVAVTGVALEAIEKASKEVQNLMNQLPASSDNDFDDRWKQTLLKLQGLILSKEDSHGLRNTLGESEANRILAISFEALEEESAPKARFIRSPEADLRCALRS